MPDGPLAAAIVLVAGLLLLGIGYLLTEGLRPGRGRRRHHHHEAERLPLFGTDQLVVRRHAVEDSVAVEQSAAGEDGEDGERTEGLPAAPPAHLRPVPRPNLPPVDAPAPYGERQNGRHEAFPPRPVLEPPRAPVPPAATPPRPARPVVGPSARPAAVERVEERAFEWPPQPPSVVAPARRHAAPAPVQEAPDGAFVDGETVRFAIPTDRTLQFLPGRLEVIAGPDTGREIRFVRTPGEESVQVTFGRSEGPLYRHVQLHARTVSRQHAMMSLIDEHWELRNLSMTNPVVLNGRVLAHNEVAPLLVEGDKIEMGEVVFLFHER